MKPGEVDGKEYFFVPREKMEADIDKGKFIEYGEYKGNLYGKSNNSLVLFLSSAKSPPSLRLPLC